MIEKMIENSKAENCDKQEEKNIFTDISCFNKLKYAIVDYYQQVYCWLLDKATDLPTKIIHRKK